MDQLYIKELTVCTRIGIYAWEQAINQTLLIDILIPFDFSNCNDELANTLDYEKICQRVTQFTESNSFQLIETVANQIAQLIKEEFNINQVTLTVSKPHAIPKARSIQVTVTR